MSATLTDAAPEADAAEQAMLDAFDAALTAIAYAASGLALFGLVWAVFLTIAGPGVALAAKGPAALISACAIPIPIP